MKKIMYLIALFAFLSIQLFAQLQNPADTVGTLITSAIRPNSQADNIATIYTNEARGTTHHYQTWAELQAMKSSRLVPYMLATVADSAGKIFQYDGSSWAALKIGGNEFEFVKIDDSIVMDGLILYDSSFTDKGVTYYKPQINYKQALHITPQNSPEYHNGLILAPDALTVSVLGGGMQISNHFSYIECVHGDASLGLGEAGAIIKCNQGGFEWADWSNSAIESRGAASVLTKGYADTHYQDSSWTAATVINTFKVGDSYDVINATENALALQNYSNGKMSVLSMQNGQTELKTPSFKLTSNSGGALDLMSIKANRLIWSDYNNDSIDLIGATSLIPKGYADLHYLNDSTWIQATVTDSLFTKTIEVSGNLNLSSSSTIDYNKDEARGKIMVCGTGGIMTWDYLYNITSLSGYNYSPSFNGIEVINYSVTGDMTFGDVIGASADQKETISIYLSNNATIHTVNFPASWKWIGAKPTQLAADEEGILTLQNYSATIIVAKYEILN
jgi:hypothetical protein